MTQCERVLDYMKEFGSISALEAYKDLGIMRLAARISDLEHRGVSIERLQEHAMNRYNEKTTYTRYKLA